MSKLQEITKQIADERDAMSEVNKQMWVLHHQTNQHKARIRLMHKQREEVLFEMVCDYVDVGEEFTIPSVRYTLKSKIRTGDTIRVVKKNAKSVNIEMISTANSRRGQADPRVGVQCRVQPNIFGRCVYKIEGVKKAVERNQTLKELLN